MSGATEFGSRDRPNATESESESARVNDGPPETVDVNVTAGCLAACQDDLNPRAAAMQMAIATAWEVSGDPFNLWCGCCPPEFRWAVLLGDDMICRLPETACKWLGKPGRSASKYDTQPISFRLPGLSAAWRERMAWYQRRRWEPAQPSPPVPDRLNLGADSAEGLDDG